MFDPLDHPGIPVDHHGRHWRELDVEPIDTRATDPYTRCRIRMMAAVEMNAARHDRLFASHIQGAEARRSVGSLGDATAERRRHIAALRAPTLSAAERAADLERGALDMAGWAARNEPEPDRSATYHQQARRHLDRLRRYADFGDRAHLPWAESIAGEVDALAPSRSAASPGGGTLPVPVNQSLSLLHDWMVQAAGRPAAGNRPGRFDDAWESLVVHESAGCYLYYGFMTEEEDRRLRPMWELHLQMQLAHLRMVSDLLRRHRGRDPQEVIGEGLPEPVSLREDRPDRGPRTPRRPDNRPDVLELLTAQHVRMDRLFGRAAATTGDEARVVFGDLLRLIAVHEIAEEQIIHPLTRRLFPDERLADRLLEGEARISDALADAVRAAGQGHLDDTIGGLRAMVASHSRVEEHDEFPRVRKSVPVQERRDMGVVVRAAEAAAAEADSRDPVGAGSRTLRQTVDHVRDALAGYS